MELSWFVAALAIWIGSTTYVLSQAGNGQGQAPVGASRVFPKTSFTCAGRPSGYYADVETGCQIYHMCDGLGRQFSYSCPNTTLFQQRMLICDHWYMVNCSRAESDYAANLLIGQRDKPFVPEEENMQRTPRPDLLDRPYAPDYSGESFRNEYKDLPSIHNHLKNSESDHQNEIKPPSTQLNLPPPTRWSLRQAVKNRENSVYSNRRNDDNDDSDLGTSFSSRYNSSGDISSEKFSKFQKSKQSNSILQLSDKRKIKVPSKTYEPPFADPVFSKDLNKNTVKNGYSTNTLSSKTSTSSTASYVTKQPSKKKSTYKDYETTTIARKSDTTDSPTTVLFEIKTTIPTTTRPTVPEDLAFNDNFDSALDFNTPSPNKKPFALPISTRDLPPVQPPPLDLLPPFSEYTIYDIATTQGPPIYYEWKAPSDSLEPPKLEISKNVDQSNPEDISSSEKPSSISSTKFQYAHNPFLSSILKSKIKKSIDPSIKSPTPRSVSPDAGPTNTSLEDNKDNNNNINSKEAPSDAKIQELQRELLIPDFLFPLETDTRKGYELEDTFNSFQVKIPHRRSDKNPWYGENAQCPECHPSFVKPGTCQPCVRRR